MWDSRREHQILDLQTFKRVLTKSSDLLFITHLVLTFSYDASWHMWLQPVDVSFACGGEDGPDGSWQVLKFMRGKAREGILPTA